MAKILLQPADYTFNASAKTVTFDNVGTLELENVLVITNLVDGIIIYNFADPAKGGTAATNVLTLEFDTTSMSNTDQLQIFYNDPVLDTAGGPLVNLGTNNDVVVTGTVAVTGVSTLSEQQTQTTALQLLGDPVFVDNAGFTDNTSKVSVAGFYFDETAGTALTENDVAAARIDSKRALVNVLEDGTTRGLRAGVVDETGASAVDALAVGGGTPHDAVDSGNPLKIGFKAANALPTAVANADRANGVADLFGRQLVAHIDPAMFVSKAFNATTTQTGTDVWTPTSGKRIAVTSVVIGVYGTTAGRIILWFGDNADTTYTAGTDQVLVAFSAAPSTTSKPFLTFTPATPVFCTTADRELHITTDAGVSIDVTVHGYEY